MAASIHFLHFDKSVGVTSKYLVCLYQSVQTMCGGDFCPTNALETLLAAFGVFMAAYINANIFGELTMILESMGLEEEQFQYRLSFCNNTMINLRLPLEIRQQVRHELKANAPLEGNQKHMYFLMNVLPPSL